MKSQFRNFPLAALAVALLAVAVAPSTAAGAEPTSDTGSEASSALPETIRWPSAVGEVVFSHRMHAEDLGAECASCHHGIMAKGLNLPHPGYFEGFWVNCKSCHSDGATNTQAAVGAPNAGMQVCGSCHPSRTERPNVEMLTTKVAIHRSCWGCHAEGRGAEASAQCTFCHQRPARADGSAAATAPSAAANRAEARTP